MIFSLLYLNADNQLSMVASFSLTPTQMRDLGYTGSTLIFDNQDAFNFYCDYRDIYEVEFLF